MKAFITGISSGVGRELTRQLIHAGHEVFGVARRADRLAELQRELGTDRLHTAVCDVANPADIACVHDELKRAGFLPDVVVLNAAIERDDVWPTYRHDITRKTFETNVSGALAWVSCFLDQFLQRGSGQFIAVSSIFAFRPNETSISSAASKAALAVAFRGFQLRYQHAPVRFSVVYFGPIATGINPRFAPEPPRGLRALFIASPRAAARAIVRTMTSRRNRVYFPWFPTALMRFTWWLPDWLFAALTRPFRR
ncbi:SDR family NAD(P)-dependent oxidoreductase [Candidatus Parcubacteria bacterium]|nr:SDR family NAD(P)-dependent oxidoreductase [Candidatus Parcubacteria bacterium]